jgi:hypothetical protein
LQVFLKLGGKVEDWGEHSAKRVKDRMKGKWERSEWVKAARERRTKGKGKGRADAGTMGLGMGMGVGRGIEWVGGSFDVTEVLGVDLLHGDDENETLHERKLDDDRGSTGGDSDAVEFVSSYDAFASTKRPMSTNHDSFFTAQSTLSGLQSIVPLDGEPSSKRSAMPLPASSNATQDITIIEPSSSAKTQVTLAPIESSNYPHASTSRTSLTESHEHSAASNTSLLPYENTHDRKMKSKSHNYLKAIKSDGDMRHANGPFKSIMSSPSKTKAKSKTVHYPDSSTLDGLEASATATTAVSNDEDMVLGASGKSIEHETPAKPKEVLSRPAEETGTTSAAASAATISDKRGDLQVGKNGVKMRGRLSFCAS